MNAATQDQSRVAYALPNQLPIYIVQPNDRLFQPLDGDPRPPTAVRLSRRGKPLRLYCFSPALLAQWLRDPDGRWVLAQQDHLRALYEQGLGESRAAAEMEASREQELRERGLTETALLETGWSDRMIRSFLGSPDGCFAVGRGLPIESWYFRSRIEEAQKSPNWRKAFNRQAARRRNLEEKTAQRAAWGALRFTRQEVLARDGWTPALIRSHLGQPDDEEIANRHGQMRWYYLRERVEKAETNEQWKSAVARRLRPKPQGRAIDLLAAIFTVNRSAKRYRDAAQACYEAGVHGFAGNNRVRKEYLYSLKERGIVQAYRLGRIHPEICHGPLIVYKGEGYCYHSLLRPSDWNPPDSHGSASEVLMVEAKPRDVGEPLLRDAIATLEALPQDGDGFIRLSLASRSKPGAIRRNWREENEDEEEQEEEDL